MAQADKKVTGKYTAIELAIKLLNFSRGLVFNYASRHQERHEAWLAFAKGELAEYMSLFTLCAF